MTRILFFTSLVLLTIACDKKVTGPSPYPALQRSASFIYHPPSEALLLFGSPVVPDSVKSDVWKWNGEAWEQIEASGPGSRDFFAGTLDTKTNELWFYAGIREVNDERVGDMWSFDGTKWSGVVAHNIGTRDHHKIVYMDHLDAFMIYGGNINGYPNMDTVTWLVKNGEFTPLNIPGPGPRYHSGMVYDKHRRKVVLYGGGQRPDEHWEFDGAAWTKLTSTETPGRRLYHQLVYNDDLQLVVLHGGWINQNPGDTLNNRTPTTWTWDGTTWKKIAEERIFPMAMGYDQKRKVIVAYGFNDNSRSSNIELWELQHTTWKKVADYGKWNTVDYLTKWVAQHPDDMQALVKYADLLQWETKQFPEAEAAYKKLEKAYPDNTSILSDLAFILAAQSKVKEADDYLQKLESSGQLTNTIYDRLAGRLANENKYTESIRYRLKLIDLDPSGQQFYNLAATYALAGDRDNAFKLLTKAVDKEFNKKEQFTTDEDLKSLRTDSRWTTLGNRLK